MIRQRSLLLTAAASIIVGSGHAAAPSTDDTAGETKVVRYELKNRSKFGLEENARAPFWPIGWKKPVKSSSTQAAATVNESANQFLIQPEHFTVTTVLSGNPPLATINGKAFGEGEVLPVLAGNERIKVVVHAIRDGGVSLQQGDHMIFVPLRRAEVAPRAAAAPAVVQEFSIKIK